MTENGVDYSIVREVAPGPLPERTDLAFARSMAQSAKEKAKRK
jgi:hypothetical protein